MSLASQLPTTLTHSEAPSHSTVQRAQSGVLLDLTCRETLSGRQTSHCRLTDRTNPVIRDTCTTLWGIEVVSGNRIENSGVALTLANAQRRPFRYDWVSLSIFVLSSMDLNEGGVSRVWILSSGARSSYSLCTSLHPSFPRLHLGGIGYGRIV
ncbi:hypothetical protein Tco_0206475 [Tanacetum coccineum]